MGKHLPLVMVAIFLAIVQVASTYWFTRPVPPVANQLRRVHVDVSNGVIYAEFDSATLGMTPHAALQMQSELTHTIMEIEKRAREVH
jgi:hypothetical protein